MGYSAGGHLALLYAYTYPNDVSLVISEAGPTDFTNNFDPTSYLAVPILSLVGNDTTKLGDISPIDYVTNASPYTILAYGTGDTIVPYSQAEILKDRLSTNNIGYNLCPLNGVTHNAFGANGPVVPTNSDDSTVESYYDTICNQLNFLKNQ